MHFRSLTDRLLRRSFRTALRAYRSLPVPARARIAAKNAFFGAIERYIVTTQLYQGWRATRPMAFAAPAAGNMSALEKRRPRLCPHAPSPGFFDALPSRLPSPAAQVDVVLPVYRGYEETLACLASVLSAPSSVPFVLTVINDASPEPMLAATLRDLAQKGLFTLIEHADNRGFVESVNEGMALHPMRDVLLLNSDAEVYGDWLGRLRQAAYQAADIATVTPLSNNAEIASYPGFVRDNPLQCELSPAELDAMAARVNAGKTVDVPTAIGFCMYIRRAALAATGPFDAERFGKGYGEENDFCLRASGLGWRHVIAGDVFVCHYGGASFGSSKRRRIQRALKRIAERFPGYENEVSRFVAADPMLPLRRSLDVARLQRHADESSLLMVTHTLGGGTEKHVQDLTRALEAEGASVFFLRPDPLVSTVAVLSHSAVPFTPNLRFDLHTEREALVETLRALHVSHLHIHHLIGFDGWAPDGFADIARRLNVAYDFTAHDYFPVCPRINLIDGSGVYCGEPDVAICEGCVRQNGSFAGAMPVAEWRRIYARFLEGSRRVYTPSSDTAMRLARHVPGAAYHVRPHHDDWPVSAEPCAQPFRAGDTLRLAVIGALGAHKGSQVLLECARAARAAKLPVEWVVVGQPDVPVELARTGKVRITGAYDDETVLETLRSLRCHAAFFPSVWPETYCYTLSIAQAAGLFPIAFDFGAIAERIRASGWGALLPLMLMQDTPALARHLLTIQPVPRPAELVSGGPAYGAAYYRTEEEIPLPSPQAA